MDWSGLRATQRRPTARSLEDMPTPCLECTPITYVMFLSLKFLMKQIVMTPMPITVRGEGGATWCSVLIGIDLLYLILVLFYGHEP